MSEPTVATRRYLERLGLGDDLEPSLETLFLLHARHLDTVPYESLATMLGRPPSVDPAACLARVGEVGRAGYCFHQNGALDLVLRDLGFDTGRRHAHVYSAEERRGDTSLNHLALVVDALPTADNPDGRWWADVGLGDCFRDPLPVLVGTYEQGGFTYEITDVGDDGWSFRHDLTGSFLGIEVTALPIDQTVVLEAHARLTTPPTGDFTRVLVVQRRGAAAADTVRGCLWTHVEGGTRSETQLTSYGAWRAALAEGMGLSLSDVDESQLEALFQRSLASFREWDAAGRP